MRSFLASASPASLALVLGAVTLASSALAAPGNLRCSGDERPVQCHVEKARFDGDDTAGTLSIKVLESGYKAECLDPDGGSAGFDLGALGARTFRASIKNTNDGETLLVLKQRTEAGASRTKTVAFSTGDAVPEAGVRTSFRDASNSSVRYALDLACTLAEKH